MAAIDGARRTSSKISTTVDRPAGEKRCDPVQPFSCNEPAESTNRRGGAAVMNIEVAHSMRHGGKDVLIDEEIPPEAARLQMGHRPSDDHSGYGTRVEFNRKQCQELAHFELRARSNGRCSTGSTSMRWRSNRGKWGARSEPRTKPAFPSQ
jgi:hypothetical protein